MFLEPPEVKRCPIPFMGSKPVLGPLFVVFAHDPIAGDLGNNRGGAYAAAESVSFYDGETGYRERLERIGSIDDNGLWLHRKPLYGKVHGFQRGLEDVDAVNLIGVNGGRSERDFSRGGEPLVQGVEISITEELAVCETGKMHFKREDDGASDNRACERASSGLIDPSNGGVTLFSQLGLKDIALP